MTGVNTPSVVHQTDPAASLGTGIRAERLRQNMTLAGLAELT